MKTLLKILAGLAGVVIVLVLVAFALPRTYRVQRSAHIQSSGESVYSYVADLRRWKEWGIWYQKDPKTTVRYSEKSDTIGAWTAWVGKGDAGKMTITSLQPPSQMGYRMEFGGPPLIASGSVEIVPDGAGVSVTMAMEGDLGNNPVSRWFGLFIDQMVGPDFDGSLANLKRLSEKGR